ncbi:hypothetical protein AVEN_164082-1 [Araneus ventricosus]|uniref:Uncharacterized protein n=1 Tax=Araneus ventricosus TaxID=182803 RepID=A0A4Y2JU87_ARAVE|nr:hypothetical protein AVEN_164082-1 [Araneus ventricosus]
MFLFQVIAREDQLSHLIAQRYIILSFNPLSPKSLGILGPQKTETPEFLFRRYEKFPNPLKKGLFLRVSYSKEDSAQPMDDLSKKIGLPPSFLKALPQQRTMHALRVSRQSHLRKGSGAGKLEGFGRSPYFG